MIIDTSALATLFSVIMIDAVLAVDNAIVMGTAAAKLPVASRKRAIVLGVGAAAILRAFFALFAVKLLMVPGVSFAGGLMLVWVAYKLWSDLRAPEKSPKKKAHSRLALDSKTLRQAVLQILIADISVSLDNVLAVAGAARSHTIVMIIGLICSVLLMGFAANSLARVIVRYSWISSIGIAIIVYVSATMIWEGANALAETIHF